MFALKFVSSRIVLDASLMYFTIDQVQLNGIGAHEILDNEALSLNCAVKPSANQTSEILTIRD